jgi:hypothetical protein
LNPGGIAVLSKGVDPVQDPGQDPALRPAFLVPLHSFTLLVLVGASLRSLSIAATKTSGMIDRKVLINSSR